MSNVHYLLNVIYFLSLKLIKIIFDNKISTTYRWNRPSVQHYMFDTPTKYSYVINLNIFPQPNRFSTALQWEIYIPCFKISIRMKFQLFSKISICPVSQANFTAIVRNWQLIRMTHTDVPHHCNACTVYTADWHWFVRSLISMPTIHWSSLVRTHKRTPWSIFLSKSSHLQFNYLYPFILQSIAERKPHKWSCLRNNDGKESTMNIFQCEKL